MQAGVITALEVQKRNRKRVNVYLDGEYAFSLPLIEAARLRKGQQLTEADIAALKGEDAVNKAVDRALRFLAYRPRSVVEVRKNLAQHDVPESVIEAAVSRLSAQGYLDDQAFVSYWVENRSTFNPLSPRALRYELKQKGVADAVINAALERVDAGDSAYRAALGKAQRLRGTSRKVFREKIAGQLQRRGFSFGIIRDTIQKLAHDLLAEDPEFFAEDEHDYEE